MNPNVEQMGKDMDSWIDNDYTFLTELQKARYKKCGYMPVQLVCGLI